MTVLSILYLLLHLKFFLSLPPPLTCPLVFCKKTIHIFSRCGLSLRGAAALLRGGLRRIRNPAVYLETNQLPVHVLVPAAGRKGAGGALLLSRRWTRNQFHSQTYDSLEKQQKMGPYMEKPFTV